MRVMSDVKCYHCGHVSGQVEGTRTDRLVFHTFRPRPGYRGEPPKRGRLRCDRCQGPVFLEDIRSVADVPLPIPFPPDRRRKRSSGGRKAA